MNRLVAGLLCATTIACGSPAPSSSSPPPPATLFALTGRVTDTTTSSPLSGASVEVADGPNISKFAVSDAIGAFRIADLAMGGFTLRARGQGYDSGYFGINLIRDTFVDFQLSPVMTTLAGTWAGFVAFSTSAGSQTVTVLQATLMQAGASVLSNTFSSTTSPYQGSFSGTLQDPSAIGSTTGFSGTLTVVQDISGRSPGTCRGTTAFTGTTNWTRMSATAQPVVTDCGTTFTNVTMSFLKQQ